MTQILLQRETDAGGERAEHRAVRVAALMHRIPVSTLDTVPQGALADPLVIPVGTVAFVLDALRANGITIPPAHNYPAPLRKPMYLHRPIYETTLCDACARAEGGERLWIKPAGHQKSFPPGHPGFVKAPPDTAVFCSIPVTWLSEWRYYVTDGRVVWSHRYDLHGVDDAPEPDREVVGRMVAEYQNSGAAPAGYALDAGVLGDGHTALVEVNDGYALGFYGPVATKRAVAYLSLLINRFSELRRTPHAARTL